MSLKTERDLSQGSRHQFNRAKDAIGSRNFDYAITLLQGLLKDEPLFLDGRRLLRAVEIQRYESLNSFSKQMMSMKVASSAMKLTNVAKKDPKEQLILAEEVLSLDPFHSKGNTVIADAGVTLGYLEFKAFAYETVSKGRPTDKLALHELGKTYLELKEYTKAVTSFERLLDLDPRDGDAASALRDAMAAKTHEEDWKKAEQGGYREALKDKKEAEQLEQQGKVVKSGSAIEDLIRLNFEKHQAEPTNPNHPKAIADLYLQKSDYPNAITWYTAAFEAGGKVDSSLEKTIGDLRLKQVEKELQQLEASKVQSDDPDQQAIHEATIQEKKKELDDVRLFQAEARVRAYPNEGQYHFELGEALFKVGRYQDALRELQMGKKQPSVRHKAMNLLGLSFLKLKMNDMAVRNFAEAANELPVMDDVKMEIVYNLGLAYEAIKQPDKALEECWKKIYDYDMGYRDVAKRVEESYSRES